MSKERRLGRGLAALLSEREDEPDHGAEVAVVERPDPPAAEAATGHSPASGAELDSAAAATSDQRSLLMLGVHDIDDNPFQPRREFSESEIASLAESLKEHDMLQPVLVRRVDDRWQLISGERRLRAAIRAGWSQVPAQVKEADDRLVAELAIVENLQRKDLNPIEKALSFRRYLDQHQSTQEELAKRLSIDRSTIANLLRLLELPDTVQEDLKQGNLTNGHARALLPLGDETAQVTFAQRIRREGLSVRDVEHLVAEKVRTEDGEPSSITGKPKKKPRTRSSHIASLEQRLRIALGTKIDIRPGSRGRGQLVIHFRGNDEFERLTELLLEASGEQVQRFAG